MVHNFFLFKNRRKPTCDFFKRSTVELRSPIRILPGCTPPTGFAPATARFVIRSIALPHYLFSTSGAIRTPTAGFGDRHSAIKLHSHIQRLTVFTFCFSFNFTKAKHPLCLVFHFKQSGCLASVPVGALGALVTFGFMPLQAALFLVIIKFGNINECTSTIAVCAAAMGY